MPKKDREESHEWKHGCKSPNLVISWVLMTLGIYFLVWGFMLQTGNTISWKSWNWPALSQYLIGFILFGLGKMIKFHAFCKYKMQGQK